MSFNPEEMINDKKDKCSNYPFFAWQCITLLFETRTLDLVIKNESDMNRFLKFLIRAIKSVDGNAGTADFLINAATLQEIQKTEKKLNRQIHKRRQTLTLEPNEAWDDSDLYKLTDEQKEKIKEFNTKEIYRQTFFKYILMRIRSKISYYAYKK